MRLTSIRIERFRNVVNPQDISVEPDVTCLVGKNESGKTTVLQALHRLNPANLTDSKFNLTTEYPRWRLSRDRRTQDLDKFTPITANFALEDADLDACETFLPARPPRGTTCTWSRSYDNTRYVSIQCPLDVVIAAAAAAAAVSSEDTASLLTATAASVAGQTAKEMARAMRGQGESARAKALAGFPASLETYAYLTDTRLDESQLTALGQLLPKFFYFSDYDLLPGQHDLHALSQKVTANTSLNSRDESVLALLDYAQATPEDFLGSNYDQRKAELQASALELTHKVFTYWTQNRDLEVDFDTELEPVGADANGAPILHRMLMVLMRDNRHGGVVTNFETRSQGFRWFFSFLAAFSRYQESEEAIIVLLDEPGTSLHGEAQKDFLRFIFNELGRSKQVVYTTHSQYMVDPSIYEKLRALEDRSTREDPDLGVVVTLVGLSADKHTLLPVQAALGYSISQHLLLGAGRHLVVEGGSDFVYLQRLSEHLLSLGRSTLDPRLSIIPVGTAGNVPAFVALFGRHLEVSVLLDGNRQGRDAQRVMAQVNAGLIRTDEFVVVADVPGVIAKADIEDLFDVDDYLKLISWAFGKGITRTDLPTTDERILKRVEAVLGEFDHALPAHALTAHRDEFFTTVAASSLDHFEELVKLLNATIPPTPSTSDAARRQTVLAAPRQSSSN